MPDMMIHHIVGNPSTAMNEDFPASLAVVTTRPGSRAPRTGSGIRNASTARMSPGTQANQKAARQPNFVAMAPALMYARKIPAGSPSMNTPMALAR